MGIPNRSHHSKLLQAMCLSKTSEIINLYRETLYNRIFKCECPAKELQTRFLNDYFKHNKLTKNSLLQQVILNGAAPIKTLLNKPKKEVFNDCTDGFIDSLQYMILNDNYIKPYSNEHQLVLLMLKSF